MAENTTTVVKKYKGIAGRMDLSDRFHFDGTAINLQRDMERLKFTMRQVRRVAKLLGVKDPHPRDVRTIARQAITALRDAKNEWVEPVGPTLQEWKEIIRNEAGLEEAKLDHRERVYSDPSAAHEFAMKLKRKGAKTIQIKPKGGKHTVSWYEKPGEKLDEDGLVSEGKKLDDLAWELGQKFGKANKLKSVKNTDKMYRAALKAGCPAGLFDVFKYGAQDVWRKSGQM